MSLVWGGLKKAGLPPGDSTANHGGPYRVNFGASHPLELERLSPFVQAGVSKTPGDWTN